MGRTALDVALAANSFSSHRMASWLLSTERSFEICWLILASPSFGCREHFQFACSTFDTGAVSRRL